VPRITDFCICIYVFGCRLSLFRLCDGDFGITPVDDITIGIICTAFFFHIAHISFASSWYLFCLSVIVLARLCVFRTAMSIKKEFFFFISESYGRSVRSYCVVRNYAAVPVQLEVVILQYISWCVPIVWTFVLNQFSCFCQFLVDNLCYSIMPFCILGRCQLLTCRSNVLDRLRFFSTSSEPLISFWLLQNIFLVVSC